jgi:uncharacterized membrane protein (DUF106 family)
MESIIDVGSGLVLATIIQLIILEQQMEDIKKQMQVLQELIKEMKG